MAGIKRRGGALRRGGGAPRCCGGEPECGGCSRRTDSACGGARGVFPTLGILARLYESQLKATCADGF